MNAGTPSTPVPLGRCNHQFAAVEAQGQNAKLPRLTSGHEFHGQGIRRLAQRIDCSCHACVLQSPGSLNSLGINAKETFAEQSERLAGAILLIEDLLGLFDAQHAALDQDLPQSNFHLYASVPPVAEYVSAWRAMARARLR